MLEDRLSVWFVGSGEDSITPGIVFLTALPLTLSSSYTAVIEK